MNDNVLKIGISSLNEVEEKVKAFRGINPNVKKKRYILSREEIRSPEGEQILKKAQEIDIVKVKLLRRLFKGSRIFKTFQPDEGILLVSDMNSTKGINFSIDLTAQVMNIGGGSYEGFVDRVDNFTEMYKLLQKTLFPKLVIVGYLAEDQLEKQRAMQSVISKEDPYIRFLEITHKQLKPSPAFQGRMRNVQISSEERDSWKTFISEVIKAYTKPYLTEN